MLVGLKAGATPFRIAFQYSSLVELVTRLGSSPCRLVSCHAYGSVCDDVLREEECHMCRPDHVLRPADDKGEAYCV